MWHHFGLGVGHTYAFNTVPESLDQPASEGPQDVVEKPGAGNMDELGSEGDLLGNDGSDPERSVDDESTDGTSDHSEDDSEPMTEVDSESEDEDLLAREEMYT